MTTVTVLCPNGRREQVKVQHTTKILDIIEEVCKKQGLESNEHDVVFQRRHLDITLTLKLAGVPNNAMFELKKLDIPRKFEDVIIALQLEDGSRLNPHSFSPTASLHDVIEHFSSLSDVIKNSFLHQNDQFYPICAYINEQLIGTFQLKNTSLKDIGLTNGRGIIRYSYKQVESDRFAKLDADFRLKMEKKLKLEETFKMKLQSTEKSDVAIPKSLDVSEMSEIKVEKRPRIEEKRDDEKRAG